MKDTTYNGWKNRATWNVALYLQNEERLYNDARRFMATYKGRAPYASFVKWFGLFDSRTPDGFKWLSTRLSYRELNELMRDL